MPRPTIDFKREFADLLFKYDYPGAVLILQDPYKEVGVVVAGDDDPIIANIASAVTEALQEATGTQPTPILRHTFISGKKEQ